MADTVTASVEARNTVSGIDNGINKEKSARLYVFGDQTAAFEDTLKSLLSVKDNATLSDFFRRVGFQLRSHVGRLPLHEQDLFPQFTTLVDLFARHEQFAGSPALKFTLLCVTQIAQFIKYYGGRGTYPPLTSTYLTGACTGSFAVAAISSSRSIGELLAPAVEAVIAAFKTAIYSLNLRNDTDYRGSTGSNSWSVVVGIHESEAAQLVTTFNAGKRLPPVSAIYLSCITHSNTSICGPPELLLEFLSTNSLKHLSLPIETPYHAPHISDSSVIDKIVGPFSDPSLEGCKQCFTSVSIASGKIASCSSFRELLRKAVSETLLEPMRWDIMTSSLCDELLRERFTSCCIYPISSKSVQSLSSALSQNAKLQVNIISSFDVNNTSNVTSITGEFSHSNIAVIGYSGRYPEAASNEEFWELLAAGRDVHRTIPEDRFDWKAHYDSTGKTKNTSRVKYGCFVKEPGLFDARFFNMSPRECENCDPAQRLAITSAYEAIEMAGLVANRTPSTQQDRIGVFYGVTSDDWREVNSGQDVDTYFIPGGNRAFIPGRIRFCGPSLSLDTACSSSFAAIQTACAYLWRGECDTALAGGANVLTNPDNFAGLDRGHFLSTTGNCNSFDDTANGYCRSDAVGTVILKRMEDAIADNDPIFGVIRGAYTNHCGRTDSITRPFEGDQAAVFNRIMRYAGVDPLDVAYVEMHGTGTQAGDATEMKSVLSVFAPFTSRKFPLHLGTVKANIGHAESASGVASLIKVLMMMKHNAIPPHCGIKTKINQKYPKDLKERNVHIPLQLTPWFRQDMSLGKRMVFLNNFSAAGGNTAVLLEDAPVRSVKDGKTDLSSRHQPVTVTGKTINSLKGNVENLVIYLGQYPDTSLSSLSYTTTARRTHHNYRVVVSGSDINSIRGRLQKSLEGISETKPIPTTAAKLPKIILVFTGQGNIYEGLGKQLYDSNPIFRDSIMRFDNITQQQGFPSFLPLVTGSISDTPKDCRPIINHLALVCVQMALYSLWKALGVTPSATIGHSLGEYPSLYAAGVLTASNVIYLVGTRARLLTEKATVGTHAMLAVKLSTVALERELPGTNCEIGCLNQPSNNVITGPLEQLSMLKDRFKSRGIDCMFLDIPFAFHSTQVDPILAPFETAASAIVYKEPLIPYISPLLSKVISPGDKEALNGRYLTNACRQAVNFQGAIEAAQTNSLVDEKTIWLEVGSHPACVGMVKNILNKQSSVFGSLRKDTDAWSAIMPAIEGLYLNGIEIQWSEYHRGLEQQQEVLNLPRYAWDLKNYWIQYRNNFCLTKGDDAPLPASMVPATPLDQRSTPSYIYVSPSVQRIIKEDNGADISSLVAESDIHDGRLAPILEGHVVNGALLCPSSLYADIAITIAQYMTRAIGTLNDTTGLDVADMKVINPLVFKTDVDAQLFRVAASAEWKRNIVLFKLFSINDGGRKTTDHATFSVLINPNQNWIGEWRRQAYLIHSRISALSNSVSEGNAHMLKRTLAYQLFSTLVCYNQDYQGMQEVILDSEEREATARVEFQVDDCGFKFNPCWVDSLGHIAGFIMNAGDATPTKSQVFINHGWDRMRCAIKFEKGVQYQVYNRMQLDSGTTYMGDTYIFKDNSLVAIYEGIRFQGVPRQVLDRLLLASKQPQPQQAQGNNQAHVERSVQKPEPSAALSTSMLPKQASRTAKVEEKSSLVSAPAFRPSDIASRVLVIVGEEAGVNPTDLQPNEDFQNHGIDSLLSLTIVGRLQEELGVDIPSSLFTDCPTPSDLRRFFGSSNNSSSSSTTDDGIETPENRDMDSASSMPDGEVQYSVLEIIRETIAQETGVTVHELSNGSSFADLGVDSLLALTIVGKLTEILNIDLPSSLLMENENLEEISKELGLQLDPSPASRQAAQGQHTPNVKVTPKYSFDPNTGPQSTSILLSGSPKTAKKLVWLFPDGSGSATSYASIPKFGCDIAVYGLNCPWMKKPHDMTCTLEELTSKYLVEILRRQPTGPYFLGGWSAGGICAFEAAQQLARDGSKTEKLILIDSPNPIGLENPPQRMYDFFESVGIFGSSNNMAPPSWLRPHFDAFIRLLDDYNIKPYVDSSTSMKAYMLYARDGICSDPRVPRPEIRPDDPREMIWLINNRTDFSGDGWASLVGRENLQITVMDKVNHFSMMDKGPHMKQFAAFLQQAVA
ncbi:hypothetical protein EYB26_002530 [Talaromyces marneffei]|uniref:uncharacterized protein n=1 Tax=Talaromyces marneffei TaxID=37727 RepID=UPI0012A7FCFD|nr:uncharacterized protein EYB26_002530 [Talaromyces marneffei]QGA14874.1 hypothetical protein EYB26_002530 [Talaromyces marneffei]